MKKKAIIEKLKQVNLNVYKVVGMTTQNITEMILKHIILLIQITSKINTKNKKNHKETLNCIRWLVVRLPLLFWNDIYFICLIKVT